MKSLRLFAGGLLFAGSVVAQAAPSTAVTVGGTVDKPATWSAETLRALPQHEVDVPAEHGDGTARVYRGPLLKDVVKAAQITDADRLALRQTLVVAHATDGYVALFTWAELFTTPTGEQVVLALTRDGAPLGADEGAFALVSGVDKPTGPRHVHRLDAIDVRRVSK
ncbi:MAG TPA: molybdopterin-dependent oxidoreductase [Polyangia bacterium]|nr:molybdopterin-dependent oxidoreductase [Polyangia bacterium]